MLSFIKFIKNISNRFKKDDLEITIEKIKNEKMDRIIQKKSINLKNNINK